MSLKNILRLIKKVVPENILYSFVIKPCECYVNLKPLAERTCNICGYHGWFRIAGRPPRNDAKCPNCGSLERHRLLMHTLDNQFILNVEDYEKVIHFAAEPILRQIFSEKFKDYKTADLYVKADLNLNIEEIHLPDNSIRLIIANHVLEHVDDMKASNEIFRVLQDCGLFICMVPIIEGWEETYENENLISDNLRTLHFGQNDHVRYYGRDFRMRIEKSGLKLIAEYTAEGGDVIKHGLLRGEKVFIFQKDSVSAN